MVLELDYEECKPDNYRWDVSPIAPFDSGDFQDI